MADDLAPGIYEQLITAAAAAGLDEVPADLVERQILHSAEAADRIAHHLLPSIMRAIDSIPAERRVAAGLAISRAILSEVGASDDLLLEPAEVLRGISVRNPDGSVRQVRHPLTPLLDTTLLTNSRGEPRVGQQILTEIDSAGSIDVVLAFIRRSGLLPLASALRRHCEAGGRLRVLTTTYTGSTERRALDLLAEMGAEVRVSYDISTTRLHAKAWMFHRPSSHSTAYIGSSNLTHSAQVDGLEWNVRVSAARNPDVLDKVTAVFDSYWNSGDFVSYDPKQFDEATRQADRDVTVLSPVEIRLEPFQERMLELIAVARLQGRHRNLLVSATGTGKTVMAAMDYVRLRRQLGRSRLLFVAHRQEILDQSRRVFRHALQDAAFGERWVDRSRPAEFEHVFASIQSLAASGFSNLEPDHFDVVIVDEFHHAGAATYRALLDHIRPRELLGLTATPERADGVPVLHWFDDRIAAELRLWDAIEQHRLTPFAYYGVFDGSDLSRVPWRRGHGYETRALSEVYTGDQAWARLVLRQTIHHVDDITTMRALGFCVDVAHAEFMAREFRQAGVAAAALSSASTSDVRRVTLRDLAEGRVQIVFSVDLFNEGVDVPTVDTILMLRPTESATLFLQQLGRGLRKARGKTVCTVLDFIGTHRAEFRYDLRYRALLGATRRDVGTAVQDGFPYLPAGCHLELDRVASDIVLRSIRNAIPDRWPAKVAELRALAQARAGTVSLADYLHETGLDLEDVYDGKRGWSDLCEDASLAVASHGPYERAVRSALGRLLHIDDPQRTNAFEQWVRNDKAPQMDRLSEIERRLARMLAAGVGSQVSALKAASMQDAIDLVWAHPQALVELTDLLPMLRERGDHVLRDTAMSDVPLQVHARYTRIEILAALGEGDGAMTPPWREGVYNAQAASADLLAFTLNKTGRDFSPTTRYRDYAISPHLIHWESQSMTRAASPTGQRYQHHVAMGRTILLFARENTDARSFWFLGPATYVSHEGERPMAITWRLEVPLPGDLFAAFAAAIA